MDWDCGVKSQRPKIVMRPPLTLRRLLRQFLLLEIGAVALYRTHRTMVPIALKPLFKEFESIEIGHRERFADLYRALHGGRGWWMMPFANVGATCLAFVVGLFGTKAILEFERNIERKAVADYTDALRVIEHAAVRTAIEQTLADEFRHDRLLRLLQEYRGDEERHIRELEKVLKETAQRS
jgi:demethoxyubiquinone hydroxylase (CLK1/Coq7/Cat5 family)